MSHNKNMDPPPPYTPNDFHGVNMPSSAPPGPPPPGFVLPPGATQTGTKIQILINNFSAN